MHDLRFRNVVTRDAQLAPTNIAQRTRLLVDEFLVEQVFQRLGPHAQFQNTVDCPADRTGCVAFGIDRDPTAECSMVVAGPMFDHTKIDRCKKEVGLWKHLAAIGFDGFLADFGFSFFAIRARISLA